MIQAVMRTRKVKPNARMWLLISPELTGASAISPIAPSERESPKMRSASVSIRGRGRRSLSDGSMRLLGRTPQSGRSRSSPRLTEEHGSRYLKTALRGLGVDTGYAALGLQHFEDLHRDDEGERDKKRRDRDQERVGENPRTRASGLLRVGACQLAHDQEEAEGGHRGCAERPSEKRRRDRDHGCNHRAFSPLT